MAARGLALLIVLATVLFVGLIILAAVASLLLAAAAGLAVLAAIVALLHLGAGVWAFRLSRPTATA